LEIEEAVEWYRQHSAATAVKFSEAVATGLLAIGEDPLRYPMVYRHMRRLNIASFPYGLFYRVEGDEVIVLACFHGRRDPARVKVRR
jgi:plasmid stabilization system protein ParE